MNAEPSRVAEQLTLAVEELALGSGSLHERLAEAWVHMLSVRADDVPEPFRLRFESMEAVWLSTDATDLDEETVLGAAREILALEIELLAAAHSGSD